MKNGILLVVFVTAISIFSISIANAAVQNVDLHGLTEEQKAQIVLQAEQMKKNANPKTDIMEEIDKFTGIGERAGTEFIAFAEKIGIAADKILQTDAGKWMLAIIVWCVAGKDMMYLFGNTIDFIVGTGMFFILVPMWVYYFRKLCLISEINIEYDQTGKKKNKQIQHYNPDDSNIQAHRWIMLIILIILIVVSISIAL